ncbi:MAG: hypothetical protein AB7K64_07315 [Variibacter sp.]
MTPDELDSISYLPSIRSRLAELRGYRELRAETKAGLRPIVSLGKLGQVSDAVRVLERISDSVSTEYFVDLNVAPGQTCDDYDGLCDPASNYQAWRNLVAGEARAVPVALLRDNSTERPFVRQVLEIERRYGVVAMRSRRPAQDLPALQAALAAVDDVNNLLVVLDFGYIRGSMDAKEQEALRMVSALRNIDAATRIAVMASSFPKAVSAYGDRRGTLEILEREFHADVGGDEVAIYGDHAAIYPEPFEPSISRFVPRIDYCLDEAWLYERHRANDGEDGGYVECARQLVALPEWEEDFADRAWGADKIRETAAGRIPQGFGSPANWIAARVNMHIERQHSRIVQEDDSDEDEE